MRAGLAAGLAAVALLALAGCGGSASPADVVRQAVGSRSPSRCDLYTNAFFRRETATTAGAGRAYCRRVAAALPAVKARVSTLEERDGRAVVRAVAAGHSVRYVLVREHGRWLIDQVLG